MRGVALILAAVSWTCQTVRVLILDSVVRSNVPLTSGTAGYTRTCHSPRTPTNPSTSTMCKSFNGTIGCPEMITSSWTSVHGYPPMAGMYTLFTCRPRLFLLRTRRLRFLRGAHTPVEALVHPGRSAHASVEALMPPGRGAHAPVCTDPPVFYSVPVYLLSCSLPFSSRIPVSNASLTGTHNSLMHLLGFTYALLITSHSIRGLAFPSPRAHYSRAYASVEL